MVGIVYATRREAAPFLALTAAEPLSTHPLPLYRAAAGDGPAAVAVISGMGKVAAGLASAHLILAYDVPVLVNAGLCGRLNPLRDWPVGRLLRISSVVEGDCDRCGKTEPAVACDGRWFRHLEAARLVTSDRPVFQDAWREQLAAVGDVADMEGAAVARAALLYDRPCALIKGISDAADSLGRQSIQRHIDDVSRGIAEVLAAELRRYQTDEQP